MGLSYHNLDARTRGLMAEEIQADEVAGRTYLSNYLSDNGASDWVALLKQAAQVSDDVWLAGQLRASGRLKYEVQRKKPTGGYTTAKVPVTAPETMSEGEFNRFYIRALCRRAIEDKVANVTVYRARASDIPRPESEALIGKQIDPTRLLADLRASPGVDAALGLARPNSGLSVKLP